jgi:hypothetical protein
LDRENNDDESCFKFIGVSLNPYQQLPLQVCLFVLFPALLNLGDDDGSQNQQEGQYQKK